MHLFVPLALQLLLLDNMEPYIYGCTLVRNSYAWALDRFLYRPGSIRVDGGPDGLFGSIGQNFLSHLDGSNGGIHGHAIVVVGKGDFIWIDRVDTEEGPGGQEGQDRRGDGETRANTELAVKVCAKVRCIRDESKGQHDGRENEHEPKDFETSLGAGCAGQSDGRNEYDEVGDGGDTHHGSGGRPEGVKVVTTV